MPADTDDLYNDGPAATATAEAPAEAESADEGAAEESGDEAGGGSAQSILPKEFFTGKELSVGSVCEVKVKRILDDSVLVSYVPHSKEDGEAEAPSSEMSPGEGDYE